MLRLPSAEFLFILALVVFAAACMYLSQGYEAETSSIRSECGVEPLSGQFRCIIR